MWGETLTFGSVAQLVEPPAHNRLGLGSNPGGPIQSRQSHLRALREDLSTFKKIQRIRPGEEPPGLFYSWPASLERLQDGIIPVQKAATNLQTRTLMNVVVR